MDRRSRALLGEMVYPASVTGPARFEKKARPQCNFGICWARKFPSGAASRSGDEDCVRIGTTCRAECVVIGQQQKLCVWTGSKPFRQEIIAFRPGSKPFRQEVLAFKQELKPLRQEVDTFRQGIVPFRQEVVAVIKEVVV